MKKGVPVSPGVAVAHAHCVEEVITSHEPYTLDDASLSGEVQRFERACTAAAREIEDTITRVSRQIGDEEAAIYRAHRQHLRDPTMLGKIRARITEKRIDSSSALQQTFEEYSALFRQISDPYLQGRLTDGREIRDRMLSLAKHRYVSPSDLAKIHLALNEADAAFGMLERAYRERRGYLVYLRVEPLFDPIRADPRFAELVSRMRLG